MHADLIATLSQHLSVKGRAKLRRLARYVPLVIVECCVKDIDKILINCGFIVKYDRYYYTPELYYDIYEYYKYGDDKKIFNIEKNYYRKLYNANYLYNNRQYGYERDLLSDSTYVIISGNIDGYNIFIMLIYDIYRITIYSGDNIILERRCDFKK